MARVDDSVLRDGEEWMDPSDTRQRRQQVGVRGWRGDTENGLTILWLRQPGTWNAIA